MSVQAERIDDNWYDRVTLAFSYKSNCLHKGPEEVEFLWRKKSAGENNFHTNYIHKDRKRPLQIPDDASCGIWRRRGTLTFEVDRVGYFQTLHIIQNHLNCNRNDVI